jgi:hypothetical protein
LRTGDDDDDETLILPEKSRISVMDREAMEQYLLQSPEEQA